MVADAGLETEQGLPEGGIGFGESHALHEADEGNGEVVSCIGHDDPDANTVAS